jgi:DHA1 family multidrug resistance protein-like MFS transporter
MTHSRPALWQRNLWILAVAEMLTMLVVQAGYGLVPYYVQEMGLSDTRRVSLWFGSYQALGTAGYALSLPAWGLLADRYGRKLGVVRALAATSVIAALNALVRTPAQLMVVRALQGLIAGTGPACASLLAAATPPQRRTHALGLLQATTTLGATIGPVIGGLLADAYGYRTALRAMAALSLLALALDGALLREPERADPSPVGALPSRGRGALRELGGAKPLTLILLFALLLNAVLTLTSPVQPLFVQQLVRDPTRLASVAGLVAAAVGLTASVSAIVLGRLASRVGEERMLLGCSIAGALTYLPHALVRSIAGLATWQALHGIGRGGIGPTINALVVERAPKDKTTVALGLYGSASCIGTGIGPLLGSALYTVTSAQLVFLASGVLLLAACTWLGWRERVSRAQPAQQMHPDV